AWARARVAPPDSRGESPGPAPWRTSRDRCCLRASAMPAPEVSARRTTVRRTGCLPPAARARCARPAPVRRGALVQAARNAHVPLVEDNPYGELWFDEPTPPALASHWPEGSIYLGSFSKVLAPGFRLGYLVAPPELAPK